MPDKGDCALNVVFMGILEGKRLNARAGGMRTRKRAPIVFMREQILQRGCPRKNAGSSGRHRIWPLAEYMVETRLINIIMAGLFHIIIAMPCG